MSPRVHTGYVTDSYEPALRRGDIAGAAFAGLGDTAALRNARARSRVAAIVACAAMTRLASGLIVESGAHGTEPYVTFARAAIDIHTSAWPLALEELCAAVTRLDGEPCVSAAALIYVSRYCVLGGELHESMTLLDRACTIAEQAHAPGLLRRAHLTKARVLALAGKLDAALVPYQAALALKSPRTSALECTVAIMLNTAQHPVGVQRMHHEVLTAALHSGRLDDGWCLAATLAEHGDPSHVGATGEQGYANAFATVTEPLAAIDFFAAVVARGNAEQALYAIDALQRTAQRTNALGAHAYLELSRARFEARGVRRASSVDHAFAAAKAFAALGLTHCERLALDIIVSRTPTQRDRAKRANALTKRQREVIHLLRSGASNRDIAAALHISEHTVARHVTAIFTRLHLQSRWQLVDAPTALDLM